LNCEYSLIFTSLTTALKNQSHEAYQEALEKQLHYEAYQRALKKGIAIPLKYLKVLFFGPPRTGKTSMRRRLVGEIQNLATESVQESTGTAEVHDVIVKPFEDKTTTCTSVITKCKWLSVKSLFRNEKGTCVTDLDSELQLLYQFTYGAAPTNEKVPNPIIEEEAQDKDTKGQSPAKADNVPSPTETINPNTSAHQDVSSVEKSGDGLNPEQMEEIEKAFKAFNKILLTAGQEPLKDLLDKTILMNMVDTGGQPAFLEMLPALTMGPALYLVFFRLNQELKQSCKVQYVKGNKNFDLDDFYTNEEVIFQALSSIACFSYTGPKRADMPNPSHVAMLIGTHRDQLGCIPKTVETEISAAIDDEKMKAKNDALQKEIKAIDAVLQDSLREVLETDLLESGKNLLQYASDDQLMFAVDNMTGEEAELREVQERLEDVIEQEFDPFPISASWLMFSIFLRKMGKRTLSLSQCHEIGARLQVEDTDEVLWFLHHCVGVLMHFPEVNEIKDIVICDLQVVFDSVTDLILNSFKIENVSKQACDLFKKTGKFRFDHIQKIAEKSKSDSLSLPELVKLLEHLNIIAPMKSGSSQKSVEYFMPAVLRHATEEELHVGPSSGDPVPLMIRFKCGFVPVGVFCSMIARLVAQKDLLRWTLLGTRKETRNEYILCKNKVTFRIYFAFDITLVSRSKRYEIHVVRISTSDRRLENVCKEVRETVCDTLDQVILKMKYKPYHDSTSSNQTLYELGFKCPEHLHNDDYDGHLVTPEERESQSANSLWSNSLETKPVMICRGTEKTIESTNLSPARHLVWFGKVSEL